MTLNLQLGDLSLAQGALDVLIAFLLFVVLRLLSRWQYRRQQARDDRESDARCAEMWREQERTKWARKERKRR